MSLFNRRLTQIIVVNGRYREATFRQIQGVTTDWNYDASCTFTLLPVWDRENFKRLIVVQTIHGHDTLSHTRARTHTHTRTKYRTIVRYKYHENPAVLLSNNLLQEKQTYDSH
jgi:hypothetical protein